MEIIEGQNDPLKLTSATLVGHNDLILDQVLSYLNVNDLKQCRLVNSTWYKISQPYLKKQSVIKLRFDSTEEKRNTPKKFLDDFQNAPLKNTFNGVRLVFKGVNSRFEWIGNYPPLNSHPYPPLMDFVSIYGSQLSYFEMKIVDGLYMSYRLVSIKNMLIDYMPNVEHLCVLIKADTEAVDVGPPIPVVSNSPLADDVKLNKLKKIDWRCADWYTYRLETFQLLHIPAMTEVIAYAPNLNSLTVEGSQLTWDIFKVISNHTVSTLKEIIIDPGKSLHSLQSVLDNLTECKNRNLKLESLTVILERDTYQSDFWSTFYRSFLEFITTQKDSLKNLHVRIQPETPPTQRINLPEFPQLAKVEHLNLAYTADRSFEILFGGYKNWLQLFPAVKNLEITRHDNYVRDDDHKQWPGLLSQAIGPQNNLQTLKLFHKSLVFAMRMDVDKCNELHRSVKEKFPSLKILEVYDTITNGVYSYDAGIPNNQPNIWSLRSQVLSPNHNWSLNPLDGNGPPLNIVDYVIGLPQALVPGYVPPPHEREERRPPYPIWPEALPLVGADVAPPPRMAEERPPPQQRAEEGPPLPRMPATQRGPVFTFRIPRRVAQLPYPLRRAGEVPQPNEELPPLYNHAVREPRPLRLAGEIPQPNGNGQEARPINQRAFGARLPHRRAGEVSQPNRNDQEARPLNQRALRARLPHRRAGEIPQPIANDQEARDIIHRGYRARLSRRPQPNGNNGGVPPLFRNAVRALHPLRRANDVLQPNGNEGVVPHLNQNAVRPPARRRHEEANLPNLYNEDLPIMLRLATRAPQPREPNEEDIPLINRLGGRVFQPRRRVGVEPPLERAWRNSRAARRVGEALNAPRRSREVPLLPRRRGEIPRQPRRAGEALNFPLSSRHILRMLQRAEGLLRVPRRNRRLAP